MKNKTLMKTLSSLLAVVMVLCSAPLSGFVGLKFPEIKLPEWNMFNFSVDAEAVSSSITVGEVSNVEVEDIVLIENYNGYWDGHYDENGDYIENSWFNYDVKAENVTITYKDGTTFSGTREEVYELTGEWVTVIDFQSYENQWSVGEYTAMVLFYDIITECKVIIKDSPVESIRVEDINLIENYDGYLSGHYNDNGDYIENSWFCYWVSPGTITVTYKDGTVITGDEYEIEEQTGEDLLYSSDQSYEYQWDIGEHTATINFMGMTSEYKIVIQETPIESIVIEDFTLIENHNGYWDGHYDENGDYIENSWFCYWRLPDKITVTYKDGTIVAGDCDEIYNQTGEWIACSTDQSYENQWGVGEHIVTIEFMGTKVNCKVIIEENPIERIQVDDVTLIENYNGFLDGHYDDEFDYIEDSWFRYSVSLENITVIYKDEAIISGTEYEIYEQTGEWISIHTDQSYENQWGVGEYTATAEFMGARTEFNVTVVENPVLAIFVEDIEIAEYTNGCYDNWNDIIGEYTDDEWYCYSASPQKITIVFKDGRIITGSEYEIYNQTDVWTWVETEQSYSNQWGVGEHTATIEFMGHSKDFKVIITESLIASITAEYRDELYEYVDGYYREDEEGKEYFDYMLNDELLYITINYKDGSYETVTLAEMYYKPYYSEVADFFIKDDQSYENEWGVGRHIVNLQVADATTVFYVYVVENPYAEIKISGTENLFIALTKKNGEKETLEALALDFFYIDGTDIEGYIVTNKGQYKCKFTFASDDTEYIYDKNLKLYMVGCESNTLDGCIWLKLRVYALDYLNAAVGYNMSHNIAIDYHGYITKDNIDALMWVTMIAQRGVFNEEYVQWQDNGSVICDANYMLMLMQNIFDVTLEDLKMSNNYNIKNNTIVLEDYGYGFDNLKSVYVDSLENGYYAEMQMPLWLATGGEEVNDKFIIKFDKDFMIQELYRMSPDENQVNGVTIYDFTVNYKRTTKIEPDVKYVGDIDYTFEYSSSNESVATVDKDGNVTATGTGEAEITVTVTDEYGNVVEDTCTVTVSYAWWQWLIIIFLFGWIWY